jgi:hypothetical protein
VIEAAHLTLGSHLAQRCFRLTVLAGHRCHRIAIRHIGRHGNGAAGHLGFHRALSGRTARCQPAQGQHRTQQQDEKCPEDFHRHEYSSANSALTRLRRRCLQSARAVSLERIRRRVNGRYRLTCRRFFLPHQGRFMAGKRPFACRSRLRLQSAQPFPVRRRPRCRGIEPCSPVWCGQEAIAPPAGFWCAGRSAMHSCAHRVCSVRCVIKTNRHDPAMHGTRVLPR